MGKGNIEKSGTKKRPEFEKKYTQKDIREALKEMEKGTSLRQVSVLFNVPRSTLYAKHKNLIPIEAARGPKTYLTAEEENLIVDWIFFCRQRGFPVSKSAILQCVQKLVNETERETPFKNNMPGRHWWESFCKRHPNVSSKLTKNSNSNRASATGDILNKWYSEVKDQLVNLKLLDIHPSRVFNLGESAFYFVPKGDKVLAFKDSKSLSKVENFNENESTTVLFTANADGILLPPFILLRHDKIPAYITNSLPQGWAVERTETGWLTTENFYNYITTKFYPWLVQNNIEFPIVLYINGNSPNVTLSLSEFCKTKRIELIALYPNITRVLHPLDTALFHPLKCRWKNAVDQWRIDHNMKNLKTENLVLLLKEVLDSILNLSNDIQHSFQMCGLLPFLPQHIDLNTLIQTDKEETAEQNEYDYDHCNDISYTTFEEEDARKHLEYMEKRLSLNILQDFENALYNRTMKVSDITNQGLFQYWLDIKNLCGDIDANASSMEEHFLVHDTMEMPIDSTESEACESEEIDISNLATVEMRSEEGDMNSNSVDKCQ